MPKSPDSNVIVATRFSRLKDGRIDGEPASEVDVGYEALSALSEAMNLLGNALEAYSSGAPWDFERSERLEARVEQLMQCLDPADGPSSTGGQEGSGQSIGRAVEPVAGQAGVAPK